MTSVALCQTIEPARYFVNKQNLSPIVINGGLITRASI